MGTSFNVVKKALLRLGLKTVPHILTPDEEDAVKNDYIHSDMDTTEIAKKHDVGKIFVRIRAKRNGWKRLNWKRRHFSEVWKRNLPEEVANAMIKDSKGRQSVASSGSNNPMFGKPSPQGAGNGWKGWYKDHYFRSLREVMFMIKMDERGIEWKTGESKDYTIPYLVNGKPRTYRPDFVVGSVLYEIKPIRLHKAPSVIAKKEAAELFCLNKGFEYQLIDIKIEKGPIKAAYDKGDIRFDRDYEKRFLEYAA